MFHSPSTRSSYSTHSPSLRYSQSRNSYGGYSGAPPLRTPAGPPAGADPQLWQWFTAVDVDRSGSISVTELQAALVNVPYSRAEFSGLWKYIADWQNVFRHFDRDHSGSIDGRELADALRSFGYNLSPSLLQLVEQKYASGPVASYGEPSGITFDRFVRACVVVKTLTESFQQIDSDRDGWIQVNYEDFMKIVLSAP
ncbi:hypothetical protein EW026_g2732 [Hermanssonia centrifuga]|uniref:EF-hand domain-containing protein n=1 Tax=Hermanssonia centrifuga TaxID=98765 RepID=A0A4S4KMA3_9APHY|nr:hypothetical protein EW026_g2732 [Hermanssonia centrifuga]